MKIYSPIPQPSQSDYINAIVKLGSRVYEAAQVTLYKNGKLSERLHNNIWIKREDRQPVNSFFKLRGAYAMISSLSEEQKQQA